MWVRLGAPDDRLRHVVASRNADGRLEVFGTASDDSIWHNWQTSANNGWSGWHVFHSAGDRLRSLAVGQNQDGRLEVFGTAGDDSIWHTWQTSANNGWSSWNLFHSGNDRLRSLEVGRNQDGRIDRSTLEKLSKDEIDELRRIAIERRDNPNRVRALGFLVQLEDSEARDAVRKILANPDENGDVRAAAAALVTRMGSDADSALIEGLRYATEPFVRRRIAASLGEVGSRRAGEALRELARDDDRAVRTQAEFSLSLLAAREGIDGFRLPIPSRGDILQPRPDDARPFTVHRASLSETARVLDSLGQRPFGVSVTRDGVHAIACERDHMMLAFDERVTRADAVKWVTSRPSLVALAAAPAPDEDAYAVQWLIFAWPENREQLHLSVHRTSGQQLPYGVATVEGRAINFSLESLRGPGRLAIRLRGWFSDGKLEVHEAVAARRREPAMAPQPFELRGGPHPSD